MAFLVVGVEEGEGVGNQLLIDDSDSASILLMDGLKKAIASSLIVAYVLFVATFYVSSPVSAQEKSPTSTLSLTLGKNTAIIVQGDKQDLLVRDNLGSTRLVQNSDGSTSEQSHYPYGGKRPQAFGNLKTNPDKYFTGHRELEDLTTYHAGARFYSPVLSTFIQPDKVEAPNRYQYVKNNPVMLTDPTGNCATCNHSELSASSTYAPTMGYDNSGRTLSDADRLLQENPEEFWSRTKQLYLFGAGLLAPFGGVVVYEAATSLFTVCAANVVVCNVVGMGAAEMAAGGATPYGIAPTIPLSGEGISGLARFRKLNVMGLLKRHKRSSGALVDLILKQGVKQHGASLAYGSLDEAVGKIGQVLADYSGSAVKVEQVTLGDYILEHMVEGTLELGYKHQADFLDFARRVDPLQAEILENLTAVYRYRDAKGAIIGELYGFHNSFDELMTAGQAGSPWNFHLMEELGVKSRSRLSIDVNVPWSLPDPAGAAASYYSKIKNGK